MISGLSNATSTYLRPASASNSNATSGVLSEVPAATDAETSGFQIDVSQVRHVQGARVISAADHPVLHDLMATNWLTTHDASANQPAVSDDASQNAYARVTVDGKVVATLYNGGSSTLTNEAAAKIGKLEDPPDLSGPDLAQWRADSYARLMGGTVEKAPTAITQSQWTPRQSSSTTYSRDQLDAAFQAMLTEGQKAQLQSPYSASGAQAGMRADIRA